MSYIPNCREEGPYNEGNLRGKWADAVRGFDIAADEIDCLFDNLEVYPDVEMILDKDVAVVNRDKITTVREAVADWLEMKRNEMITAYIDHQAAEEEG